MRKYSHSPYFAAKKAAARKITELAGLSVGAFPSVERRVAALGQVFLPRTAGFLEGLKGTSGFRRPSRSRYSLDAVSELGGFTGAMGVSLAMDIGEAIVRDVKTLADPRARAVLKRELLRDLRIVRRPWYYANETKRRRALAAERRKVRRATTTAPCPTPEELLAAWNVRKDSTEAMIRLGSLLRDLSCYVDSTLRFDESGSVVGRNGGIRGWLGENLPELSAKYKTLMRYKAMDRKLRQATGTRDPIPTWTVYERAKTLDETSGGAEGAVRRCGKLRSADAAPSCLCNETPCRNGERAAGRKAATGRDVSRMCGETEVGEINENLMRKILVAAAGRVERGGSGGEMKGRGRGGSSRCGERGECGECGERGGCGKRGGRAGRGGRGARMGARESFATLARAIDLSVRVECVGYC